MGESRDPVIKLFGKTIQLLAITKVLAIAGDEVGGFEKKAPSNKQDGHESEQIKEATQIFQEEGRIDEPNISETKKESADDQKNRNTNNSVDKTLKKPDQILPCPRCSSMDTKFCYFNNYNVSQPRHFCKKCQRYWTEGGSMRNVPVGAGRRKSKSSATNHRCQYHITIPDFVQADCFESINHTTSLKLHGTILCFGADAPCFESMDPTGEDRLNRSFMAALNSTVLGKRSREGNMLSHSYSEKEGLAKSDNCLLIPKTGKLDGHENAVNCSVWTKLGFKNDKPDRFLKNRSKEASQVLCANPAAFSRAFGFQERS